MIHTLRLLLILAFILLIFPKNLSIFLQQHTKHSATIQKQLDLLFQCITNFYEFLTQKQIVNYSI